MANTDTAAARQLADSLLSADEEDRLILALVTSRGDRSCSTEEARTLLEHARRVRLQSHALDLVMRGMVSIDVDPEGRIVFGRERTTPGF